MGSVAVLTPGGASPAPTPEFQGDPHESAHDPVEAEVEGLIQAIKSAEEKTVTKS